MSLGPDIDSYRIFFFFKASIWWVSGWPSLATQHNLGGNCGRGPRLGRPLCGPPSRRVWPLSYLLVSSSLSVLSTNSLPELELGLESEGWGCWGRARVTWLLCLELINYVVISICSGGREMQSWTWWPGPQGVPSLVQVSENEYWRVYEFTQVAITKCQRLGSLHHRNLFLQSFRG